MKTKYLLMSAAFLGLFAACSQDDVFEASAPASDNLANRPVVGEVELVTDGAETRYNYESGTTEEGDAIGLYLMDEFSGYNYDNTKGELDNANTTAWTYQSNWWTMYTMVDYIQSNYGYEKENGKWINRASQLVEGNYIVMLPKNDEATNRRDLWHEIKPVVDMKRHSTMETQYYVGRDNQFALDYAQIHRDQKRDASGKLTLGVTLNYILSYAKFGLYNNSDREFIATKMVFRAPKGKSLPTVAYVKPAAANKEYSGVVMPGFIADQLAAQGKNVDKLLDECGNELARGLYKTAWFDQSVARSMVQYASTEDGHVPYGLENETPAYEYVFNFPDEYNGGVLLKRSSEDQAQAVAIASIALPAFDYTYTTTDAEGKTQQAGWSWKDMEVVVYGYMWDQLANDGKGMWKPGVMRKKNFDNADWNLNKLALWTSYNASGAKNDIPTATLEFDNRYFSQDEEIRVETTEDLIELLTARLTNSTTTEDINFEVMPYGTGLEITDEVVKLITDYTGKHSDINVSLTFKGQLGQGKTPVILKSKDCIELFKYQGINVDLQADQTIYGYVSGIMNLTNEANLTVYGTLAANEILNTEDGTIASTGTISGNIENHGTLTLTGKPTQTANVYGNIVNENKMTTSSLVYVSGNITNDNTCVGCGRDAAILTVADGKLTVGAYLNNYNGIVTADGNLQAWYINNNGGTMTLNGDASKTAYFYNYGLFYLNGYLEVTGNYTGNRNDYWISIGEDGYLRIGENASFINYSWQYDSDDDGTVDTLYRATIDVEGKLDENVVNYGIVNVIDYGNVVVNGNVNKLITVDDGRGIIDITDAAWENYTDIDSQAAKDRINDETTGNIFQITIADSITASSLEARLKNSISSRNYTGGNWIRVIFDADKTISFGGLVDVANVKEVIVKSNVSLTNHTRFMRLKNTLYGLTIEKGAKLTVGDGLTFKVATDGNPDAVGVLVNGELKVNNTARLKKNVEASIVGIYGTGTVQIETQKSDIEWLIASFTGKKPGWNE